MFTRLAAAALLFAGSVAQAGTVVLQGNVNVDASTAVSGSFNAVAPSPQVLEGAVGEWTAGSTLTITAPANFAFDTSQLVTAGIISAADATFMLASPTATPTASTITFTITAASSMFQTQLQFNNIRIRATSCSPTVNPGDVADVTVTSSAAPIMGNPLVSITVTAANGPVHHYRVTAAPAIVKINETITITVQAEDACNNPTRQGMAPPANIAITAGGAAKTFADGDIPGNFTLSNIAANTADILAAGNLFDANGRGTFKITSATAEGPIAVTVDDGTASGTTGATWIDPTIVLTPPVDTNRVGTMHTVTAKVQRNGINVPFVFVGFTVTGINNLVGVGLTDVNGETSFTYTGLAGTPGVGADMITASTTVDGNLITSLPVVKNWINPECTLSLIPATNPKLVNQVSTVQVQLVDGNPIAAVVAQAVTFNVLSGPNAGLMFAGNTNGIGQLDFTGYTTSASAGTDVIELTGIRDGVPFSCMISQEWITTGATLTPVTATNRVGTMHMLEATVVKNGVLQNAVPVTFTVVGVNPQIVVSNTNASGIATFSFVGVNPGTDTITATGTAGGQPFTSNAATKNWIDPVCTGLTPPTAVRLVGTAHTVTAKILRWAGGPNAVGATVNFSVTAGPNAGAAGMAVTDGAGDASFIYNSNGLTGTDTISATATVDGITQTVACTATIDWVNTGCMLTPATDTNPIGTPHTVTATVLLNGVPQAGVTVNFATVGANVAAGMDITDANGHAEFTYNGALPGVDTITSSGTVLVLGTPVPFNCTATKTWVTFNCNVVLDAPTSKVGTLTTATASILVNGAVPLFPPGVPVQFNVVSGPNVGNAGLVNTNGAGAAAFTYASNGLAGTDVINTSVTINGSTFNCAAVNKEWIDPSCSFTATTPALTGSQRILTITVLRKAGTPAVGIPVAFVVTGANNLAGPGDPPFITDAMGRLTFTYTGANSGIDTITATTTIDGVGPNICTVQQEWTNTGCMLTPANDTNQINTPHIITIDVTKNGVAQPGVIVGFEIVSGPNTGITDVGLTNALGRTTFTYTGAGGAGMDTINATGTVGGFAFLCTATKTWIDISCSLAPLVDSNQVGTNHTVTASVLNGGAPINPDGGQILFEILAGSPNAGGPFIRFTGGDNNADFTYTSNGTIGTDTIRSTGTVSGVPFSCMATKNWINAGCSLLPATETVPVNTSQDVTVTVTRNGAAAPGVNVAFNVTAGPNAGKVGNFVTNAAGAATFSYTGAAVAGTDTITASGLVDGVPFNCTATKDWILDDDDGVPPDVENMGPNNGDGNNDGIPDSLQPNVTTFLDINGNFVTIESPLGTILMNVLGIDVPAPDLAPPGVLFPYGFFSFAVKNIAPGGGIDVRIFLHGGPTVNTYYKFGATPIIPVDHFYRFLFDGNTGSEVNADIITLHLIDGQRGDDDITVNGIIVEPGGPALESENPQPLVNPDACGLCGGGVAAMTPLMIAVIGIGRGIARRRR
ncbi:MAG: Ig-like domain-containing protein [Planctomycetota bacterium]